MNGVALNSPRLLFLCSVAVFAANGQTDLARCFGNGIWLATNNTCVCNPGWEGDACTKLKLRPLSTNDSFWGYYNISDPSWGGTVVYKDAVWNLFMPIKKDVGPSASGNFSNHVTVRAVSHVSPQGPYTVQFNEEELPGFRADVHLTPNGSLVLFTTGNVGGKFGIVMNVSYSGSPTGPWKPQLMFDYERYHNRTTLWNCGLGDPSATILRNGSVLLAYRTIPQTPPCERGTAEHIGLLFASHWTDYGGMTYITTDNTGPLFNMSISAEDPYLYWSESGVHMLFHAQGSQFPPSFPDHRTRGGYAYATGDGTDISSWVVSFDAWPNNVTFSNGTLVPLARRQRPSLVFANTSDTHKPTHLINGVDLVSPDGLHWNHGWTMIQEIDIN
eukprot:m.47973 g.47973  ORF g.47973 m.47973 type:complete len:387 (-) comp10543_c0_seq5:1396-2556(-)